MSDAVAEVDDDDVVVVVVDDDDDDDARAGAAGGLPHLLLMYTALPGRSPQLLLHVTRC